MKLKFVAVAAALIAGSTSVLANDVNQAIIIPASNTYAFTAVHTDSSMFTDMFTFTFAVPGAYFASGSLVTINLAAGNNIDFTSAMLGSTALTLSGPGPFEYGSVIGAGPYTNSVVLKVSGNSDAINGGNWASYSGTINITPVPEPETYAMLLAGLGALGFLARRRQNG